MGNALVIKTKEEKCGTVKTGLHMFTKDKIRQRIHMIIKPQIKSIKSKASLLQSFQVYPQLYN